MHYGTSAIKPISVVSDASDYRFKRPSEKQGDRFDAENADKNPVNQCSRDFICRLYHQTIAAPERRNCRT